MFRDVLNMWSGFVLSSMHSDFKSMAEFYIVFPSILAAVMVVWILFIIICVVIVFAAICCFACCCAGTAGTAGTAGSAGAAGAGGMISGDGDGEEDGEEMTEAEKTDLEEDQIQAQKELSRSYTAFFSHFLQDIAIMMGLEYKYSADELSKTLGQIIDFMWDVKLFSVAEDQLTAKSLQRHLRSEVAPYVGRDIESLKNKITEEIGIWKQLEDRSKEKERSAQMEIEERNEIEQEKIELEKQRIALERNRDSGYVSSPSSSNQGRNGNFERAANVASIVESGTGAMENIQNMSGGECLIQ